MEGIFPFLWKSSKSGVWTSQTIASVCLCLRLLNWRGRKFSNSFSVFWFKKLYYSNTVGWKHRWHRKNDQGIQYRISRGCHRAETKRDEESLHGWHQSKSHCWGGYLKHLLWLPQPGIQKLSRVRRSFYEKDGTFWTNPYLGSRSCWHNNDTRFVWEWHNHWSAVIQNKDVFSNTIFLNLGVMENLIDGSLLPDCPLPCRITHSQTKF